MFEYRATVEEVVDGDTLTVSIDLGFRVTTSQRVRLLGVDTAELRASDQEQRERAQAAKAFVRAWVEAQGGEIVLRSKKPGGGDKYGRYLAVLVATSPDGNEHCLNDDLVAGGFAAPYSGGAKR